MELNSAGSIVAGPSKLRSRTAITSKGPKYIPALFAHNFGRSSFRFKYLSVRRKLRVCLSIDGSQYRDKLASSLHNRARKLFNKVAADGQHISNNRKYHPFLKKAVVYWRRAAFLGNEEAQHNLAMSYARGEGIKRNDCLAFYWWRKAAIQGHVKAQNNLGCLFYEGRGCSLDYDVAFIWCRKSAESGHSEAAFNLALCFEHGHGTDKNLDEAKKWYEIAGFADDNADAWHNLGLLYYHEDVSNNSIGAEKAIDCWERAAALNHHDAIFNLGSLYYDGDIVPMNLSKAVFWLQKAATDSQYPDAIAQFALGECHFVGEEDGVGEGEMYGVNVSLSDKNQFLPFNYHEAKFWYKCAAKQGHVEAMFRLATCLEEGSADEKSDFRQAFYWYHRAAKNGHIDAQFHLGCCYDIADDYLPEMQAEDKSFCFRQAKRWYLRAARDGNHKDAQDQMARHYELEFTKMKEKGTDDSTAIKAMMKSLHWFDKAANQGQLGSIIELGKHFLRGVQYRQLSLLEKNIEKAIELFTIAAQEHEEGIGCFLFAEYCREKQYISDISCNTDEIQFFRSKEREYLMKAAELGIANAWIRLKENFVDDVMLHEQWDVARLNSLHDLVISNDVWLTQQNPDIPDKTSHIHPLLDSGVLNEVDTDPSIDLLFPYQNAGIANCPLCNIEFWHRFEMLDADPEYNDKQMDALGSIYIQPTHIKGSFACCSGIDAPPDYQGRESLSRWKGGFGEVVTAKFNLPSNESISSSVNDSTIDDINISQSYSNKNDALYALKRVVTLQKKDQTEQEDIAMVHSLREEMMKMRLLHNSQYITKCYGHTMLLPSREVYLVMELAPFGDLDSLIKKLCKFPNDYLPVSLIVRWMMEIANGLQDMHRFGMKHLDIKPANVLVFQGLHVKLTDLGLTLKEEIPFNKKRKSSVWIKDKLNLRSGVSIGSKESDVINKCLLPASKCSQQSKRTVTRRGTEGYMAPEVLQSLPGSIASDIFSFGMTCVHVINRSRPSIFWRESVDIAERRILMMIAAEKNGCSSDAENATICGLESFKLLINQCCEPNKLQRPTATECVRNLKIIFTQLDKNGGNMKCIIDRICSL